ncbi:MAG: helix-turn-helix domain-containing protein [Synergistes sp.]|nr:helix-turn-helix domain-containing protein [Synergistes sp.]
MPRAIVTPELTETLRSVRLSNNIPAKLLAEHIKKSPAYVSKLERGGIQTIDTEELYSILKFITNQEDLVGLADQIYKSLTVKYSRKEIEDQLWFTNFDTVECLLPIPDELIKEMNARIASLGISRQYLNNRINANEALSTADIEDKSIAFNQWYHQKEIGGNAQSIKIKLSEQNQNGILDGRIDVAPYIFVFCIVFYLLKIEKYGDITAISDEENSDLMKAATSLLNSHKFLSISEKNALLAEQSSRDDFISLLSSFDKDNIDIINDILSGFRFASAQNIKSTNEQLKLFSQNMHWDLGFMLALISRDFKQLDKTSVSNKKKLLEEIGSLIEKFADLPDEQNLIEEY